MRRPKTPRRSEPRCARCGNEEDLLAWDTGEVYCKPCTWCDHGDGLHVNGICVACLRKAYTVWTFEGPRIRDLARYWQEAYEDYGLRATEIIFWTFDEEDLALQDASSQPPVRASRNVRRPPPHHRF